MPFSTTARSQIRKHLGYSYEMNDYLDSVMDAIAVDETAVADIQEILVSLDNLDGGSATNGTKAQVKKVGDIEFFERPTTSNARYKFLLGRLRSLMGLSGTYYEGVTGLMRS